MLGSARTGVWIASVALAICACAPHRPVEQRVSGLPPRIADIRLLLLVVIDQGGSDVLERARPFYRDGLKRLLDEGATFAEARHRHAVPSTCSGHASLVTGAHPSRSGIVDNDYYDHAAGSLDFCVGDPVFGVSPKNLDASTLGDWIKKDDPAARVVAVSGKDRAAALLAGKLGDGAFWYDAHEGKFITSPFYAWEDPAWLRGFNEPPYPDARFGTAWTPAPVDLAAAAARGFVQLEERHAAHRFPHPLGKTTTRPDHDFYAAIACSPIADSAVGALAQHVVTAERLGRGAATDVLAVSFSALDHVGHAYGPNSLETLDVLVALDRTIGDLLRHLERTVGREHVLVALSGDHGVMPLPEYLARQGQDAYREGAADVACFQNVWRKLEETYGRERWLLADGVLDRATLTRKGVSEREIVNAIGVWLDDCPTVEKVWGRHDAHALDALDDPLAQLYRNAFHPQRGPDFLIQRRPYALLSLGSGTDHMTPYDHDRKVPIVVYGPGVPARVLQDEVHTVDLAPTLAALLGIPIPTGLDGKDRSALVLP